MDAGAARAESSRADPVVRAHARCRARRRDAARLPRLATLLRRCAAAGHARRADRAPARRLRRRRSRRRPYPHAMDAVRRRRALRQSGIGPRQRRLCGPHRRLRRVQESGIAERVLTLKELNRATLARQLLLERKKLGVLPAIERLAGMQAQWPPSPYVGLWSRVTGFKRESLERAVVRGDVVKPTVMRGTLHLVTARDYPVFWTALREMPTWYDDTHLAHALKAVKGTRKLAEKEPLTHKQALAYLEHEHGHTDDLERRRIFHAVRRRGHLLHVPESALWRGRPLGVFHPYPEPEPLDVLAARTELVRRYLAAFGPSSRADIADWSGLRVSDFADALDALEPLRRFRDDNGRELLDVQRAPLPAADTPAPVRFLPKWDNTLLAHADRRRVLPEELRKTVIAKNGDVTQTFLVDGLVAGSWTAAKKGKVALTPFAPLPRAARRDVEEEAARLEAWLR